MIAVDIEVYDPNLKELGDGAHRKDGDVFMIGLYDGKDYACCKNDDPRLPDWLASDEDKIFHNGIYDLSWLVCGLGFKVNGTIHDTMTRCSLIDEYKPLDLDSCCQRFHIKGKNKEDTIEKWFLENKVRLGLKGTIWKNLEFVYLIPALYEAFRKYNQQDCKATYDLFWATEPYIRRDHVETYEMECALYPHWIEMKRIGCRFDVPRAERLLGIVMDLRKRQEEELWNQYRVNGEIIASNKQMTYAMQRIGVESPNKTKTGNPSWDKNSIPIIDHPIAAMIVNYKNLDYLCGNKGLGNLLRCVVNGRIYTTFKPNKREEGGAYTGRLSSSAPNLQNQPSREDAYGEKAWGPEVRSLFLPEEGDNMIGAIDYGQIETRLMAHYSVGLHAEWFRDQCRDDKVDMHQLAMDRTGIESRYIIKRINFGVPYGMGIKRMVNLDYPVFKKAATEHGVDDAWKYGEILYQQFKTGFPVLFDMMKNIEDIVKRQGFIKSLGGRIHHKPPPELNKHGQWSVPYYKMVCVQIQGSAAEILKMALLTAYKAGIFNVIPMHLTVHDENVVTIPYNKAGTEAAQELVRIMQDSYKERLTAPLTSSAEVGPNWGYWAKDIWEAMQKGDFNPEYFKNVYPPKVNKDWWCIRNGYKGLDGVLTYKEQERMQ